MSKEIIEKMDKDLRFLEDNFVNDDMTSITVDIQLIKDFRKLLDLYNKQQKQIESIEEYVNSPEFLDWHLGFTQLDELEYRKNNINKLLEE